MPILVAVVLLFLVLYVFLSAPPSTPPPPKARRRPPQKLAGGFVLEVMEGPDRGLRTVLVGIDILIGSSPTATVRLSNIAPQQCRLLWQERERTYGIIAQAGASTPTWVQRQGTEQVVLDNVNLILLEPQDRVVMGPTILLFKALT